jgi:6-phosphogluconolactonase
VPEIHTFGATDQLIRKAADLVVEAARESVRMRKRFVWLLSGGGTPAPLYRLLTQERYASRMPWADTYVFWGDERWVAPDDPDSNARAATDELLSHVPLPAGNVRRIATIGVSPADSAAAMERQIRALYGDEQPRPDLVLLGMGADGHIASLFPGTIALHEHRFLYTASHVPKLDQWRVTGTISLFNAARNIIFIVTGADKAQAVRQSLEPKPETIVLPASLVRPTQGKLVWLLDADAGRLLPHPV